MATATCSITITDTEASQKYLHVFGTIAISAATDTYATGGIALSFAGQDLIKSGSAPLAVYIQSQKSPSQAPYYVYNPGSPATLSSGKLQVFGGGGGSGTAGPTEMTNATAMNTANLNVFADVIFFEALFKFGV